MEKIDVKDRKILFDFDNDCRQYLRIIDKKMCLSIDYETSIIGF